MAMQAELEAELSGLTTMIDRWAEQIRLDETDIRRNEVAAEVVTLSGRLRYTAISRCLVDEVAALTQLCATTIRRRDEVNKRLSSYDPDGETEGPL
jgi:hypothetical protein